MANDMSPSIGRLFELTTFLDGKVAAWGIFEDRFGRVRRKFRAELEGRWIAGSFSVNEVFVYDDGGHEQRTWTVEPGAPGHFTARAGDCLGIAHGVAMPDRSLMRYKFRLKIKERLIAVDFDDRLYRVDDFRAINRAYVSKWGVCVGSATIFFQRLDAPYAAAA